MIKLKQTIQAYTKMMCHMGTYLHYITKKYLFNQTKCKDEIKLRKIINIGNVLLDVYEKMRKDMKKSRKTMQAQLRHRGSILFFITSGEELSISLISINVH